MANLFKALNIVWKRVGSKKWARNNKKSNGSPPKPWREHQNLQNRWRRNSGLKFRWNSPSWFLFETLFSRSYKNVHCYCVCRYIWRKSELWKTLWKKSYYFSTQGNSEEKCSKALFCWHSLKKYKLEFITGVPSSTQKINLYQGNNLLGELDDDNRMLGSYPIEDYMRLHIIDTNPHRIKNQYTDVSLVDKFEMSQDDYEKRSGIHKTFGNYCD